MALMYRRKAFSVISRYRLCGRFSFSSSSSATSSSVPCFPRQPSISQMQASQQLWPAMAVSMHSSVSAPSSAASVCTTTTVPSLATRNYTTTAFQARDCTTTSGACCFIHKCTAKCGCSCTKTGGLFLSARGCTTTAYPPPTPPGEFHGGDEEAEADGANLNLEEAAGDGAIPPEGSEDFNMPPYDDANYADDDDGEYEDEDPPPDPEASLLYSPSDSD